jgi:hypothetical protein
MLIILLLNVVPPLTPPKRRGMLSRKNLNDNLRFNLKQNPLPPFRRVGVVKYPFIGIAGF